MPSILRLCVASAVVVACGAYFSLTRRASAQTQIQPGQVIISELRLRGPAGAEDEFVELYNNTDQDIIVQATDTSAGWAVAISNGQITGPIFTIPNGTSIPARGHLLGANSNGYSLCNYPSGSGPGGPPVTVAPVSAAAPCVTNGVNGTFTHTTPDRTWDFDVPDGSGVALFSTTNGPSQNAATRLDAFGFTTSPALFREGAGFPNVVTANTEHTYYRDLRSGQPRDSNDNAADFLLVGTSINLQISRLGAPGPENLNSPVVNNTTISTALLDPAVGQSQPPNRERRPNVEPNANLGTILIRRTFTNNTGANVSRLRFRVINTTTLGTPTADCGGMDCADTRVLTSQDGEAGVGGQVVTVRGVRLEEPPEQPAGGGYNSSLSADFITLAQPLPSGSSVNIQFKLGVMTRGAFRFYLNIEAQTSSQVILAPGQTNGSGVEGRTDTKSKDKFAPVPLDQPAPPTSSPARPATPARPASAGRTFISPWFVNVQPPKRNPSRATTGDDPTADTEADESTDKESKNAPAPNAPTPSERLAPTASDTDTPAADAPAAAPTSAAPKVTTRRSTGKKISTSRKGAKSQRRR